jgi:hypothetical protein
MNSRTNIKEQVIRQDQRILVHTQNIYVAYLLWQNFMETNILPTGHDNMGKRIVATIDFLERRF